VLRIRQRLKGYAVATDGISPSLYVATEPTLVTDEEPPPQPKPRAPSRRTAA
jgi:hypothetical protein